jgi:hypothetical protein
MQAQNRHITCYILMRNIGFFEVFVIGKGKLG